jgi:hypothetical protein
VWDTLIATSFSNGDWASSSLNLVSQSCGIADSKWWRSMVELLTSITPDISNEKMVTRHWDRSLLLEIWSEFDPRLVSSRVCQSDRLTSPNKTPRRSLASAFSRSHSLLRRNESVPLQHYLEIEGSCKPQELIKFLRHNGLRGFPPGWIHLKAHVYSDFYHFLLEWLKSFSWILGRSNYICIRAVNPKTLIFL